MPKLTRSLPKYRLHKASQQAVVSLNGRDFYLGPHGTKTSKLEYDRLIGEWLAHGRRLPRGESLTCTVAQLVDRFLEFAEGYYVRLDGSPSKELDAYRQATKPLRELYGHRLAADLGAVALKSVRQSLIDRELTRTHINHQTNRIRREIIRPFLKSNRKAFVFSPREAMAARNMKKRAERQTPMTPSQRSRTRKTRPRNQPGERYTTESYGRAIKYAIQHANVPHWHPHQLRHNATTQFRREYGLDVAQVLLGHQSADITQIYAELDPCKAVEVVRRVG